MVQLTTIVEEINRAFKKGAASRDAEIKSLRQQLAAAQEALENEQAKSIHSCHANCTMDGCVNRKLREQLADSQKHVTLLRDVLSDFDKAAINSKSIIGFAGQSFKLITKMRKALAATEPK